MCNFTPISDPIANLMPTHHIKSFLRPTRLSDYLVGRFDELPTRSSIKKAIKRKLIKVNNKYESSGYWVQLNDTITYKAPTLIPVKVLELSFPIIFEDDYLAIIHKPPGISVSGNQFYTIQNALTFNLKVSPQKDAIRPLPVHRLDNPTSGLLIIAKTKRARIALGDLFLRKQIKKQYHAVVIGKIKKNGQFLSAIDQKEAQTDYQRVDCVPSLKNKYLSLVSLAPKTGRTHQLRIHLSSNGHPILGDKLYGIEGLILKQKGLFLCATSLSFDHPITESKINVSIPIPYKFLKRMKNEEKRAKNHDFHNQSHK